MFCSKCGSQVADGVAFCSNCGNSIAAPQAPAQAVAAPVVSQAQMVADYQAQQLMMQQQYQMQKTAVRQSEIATLESALQYFRQKDDEFEMYDAVCTLVNYYARGAKSSLLVWGCIIASLGFLVLLSGDPSAFLGGLLAFMLPGAAMIVGGILMKKNNKKKYAYYQEEYSRLSQELYTHYANYPNCPVGPEYANPDILELILDVLKSGRADTISDSINVLIAEANQAEVNEYLQTIEANTASINAQTRVAAIFAAASFFKD